ncbi:hypothetical protein [Gorillibacterium massiliense]|uniref:hypothetical protein n=1 Tax=Gorillibacterium massiliense TaxID=1280390 RepID=UPI0005929CA6|nr:hypothetical protein [Gorillibacterium massiliense]
MEMYNLCMSCMNRNVRIQTTDGVFTGMIVGVDGENVFLQPMGDAFLASTSKSKAHTSAWGFGPFGFGGFGFAARNSILTLSLFTLLAIALI